MSEVLGPISVGTGQHEVFLGKKVGHNDSYSEKMLLDIDSEVRKFLDEGYSFAVKALKKKDILIEMSETLLIRETLNSKDIDRLMAGEKILEPGEVKLMSVFKRKDNTSRIN